MAACAKCHRHPTEPCGHPEDCGYVVAWESLPPRYPSALEEDPLIAEVSVLNTRTQQYEVLRFEDPFHGEDYYRQLQNLGVECTILLTHANGDTAEDYKYQKQRDTK